MVLQPTHSQFHSKKQQLRTDLVQRHQHMPTSINKKFVQLYFSFIFPCYILFLSASQFVSTYSSCSILLHSNFAMKLCCNALLLSNRTYDQTEPFHYHIQLDSCPDTCGVCCCSKFIYLSPPYFFLNIQLLKLFPQNSYGNMPQLFRVVPFLYCVCVLELNITVFCRSILLI